MMKRNIIKMSLISAMVLSTSAYAGKIIGVTAGTPHEWTPTPVQYGFGGWNLENVQVNITSNEDFNDVIHSDIPMTETDGEYPEMNASMSFESIIYSDDQRTEIRGKLHGKDWPVGEPAGIKVVNDDTGTEKSGKSPNCIMTTSYLDEVDSGTGETGYLSIYDINPDGIAVPTICSSPFQSHKRFKVNMQPSMIENIDENGSGQPFDLTFNLDTDDNSTEYRRYQVFSKINNYTGKRLDGYKVELLDGNGEKVTVANQIRFSLDLTTKDSSEDESGYEAVFAHGLWGPLDNKHFFENGFFEEKRAGFVQDGNGTQELIGGTETLGSNYEALFGLWLPSIWAPYGIFFDDDNDPSTDAELVAFWGTEPGAPQGTDPEWHYGKDYDLTDGDQSWAVPTEQQLVAWLVDPLYTVGKIEDTLNLGLNYVVEVGQNSTIGDKFTIRITPHIAPEVAQTPPNYIDGEGNYIMPPMDYNGTEVHLAIRPAPEFTIGTNLSVGVLDTNVTGSSPDVNDTIVVVITASNGDTENLTLTETNATSAVYVGTIGTNLNAVSSDGTVNVTNGTLVTATYKTLTDSTTATDGTPVINPSSGGGGGCTYNPNSKTFDLTFLMLMALGSLYAFRRRFSK